MKGSQLKSSERNNKDNNTNVDEQEILHSEAIIVSNENAQLLSAPLQITPRSRIVKSLLRSLGLYSISNVIYYGGMFAGSVMLSNLEPDEPVLLAATGLISATEMFALHTVWAGEFAGGILIGMVQEKEPKKVGAIVQQTLLYSLLVGAPITVALCFSGAILNGLGQAPEISEIVQQYYRPFAMGAIPMVWLGAYEQLALGTRKLKTLIAIPILYVGSYLTLGYPMIYGKLGLPKLGVAGLGYARSIASLLTFTAFTAYFGLYKKGFRAFDLFSLKHSERRSLFTNIFIMGSNIAIQVGAELFGIYALSVMAGHLGADVLAAFQANLQYLNIIVIVPITLGQTLGVEVGMALGNGNRADAKRIATTGIMMSLVLPSAATLLSLAIIFSKPFRSLVFSPFIDVNSPENQDVLTMGGYSLLINSAAQIIDGVRNTTAGALRGHLKTGVATASSVINMAGLTLLLGWLFTTVIKGEAEGLFGGRGIAMLVGAVVLMAYWMRVSRIREDAVVAKEKFSCCPNAFFGFKKKHIQQQDEKTTLLVPVTSEPEKKVERRCCIIL